MGPSQRKVLAYLVLVVLMCAAAFAMVIGAALFISYDNYVRYFGGVAIVAMFVFGKLALVARDRILDGGRS